MDFKDKAKVIELARRLSEGGSPQLVWQNPGKHGYAIGFLSNAERDKALVPGRILVAACKDGRAGPAMWMGAPPECDLCAAPAVHFTVFIDDGVGPLDLCGACVSPEEFCGPNG